MSYGRAETGRSHEPAVAGSLQTNLYSTINRTLCLKTRIQCSKKRKRCVRTGTKMATQLIVENKKSIKKFLSYYERLAELGLTTLETRSCTVT